MGVCVCVCSSVCVIHLYGPICLLDQSNTTKVSLSVDGGWRELKLKMKMKLSVIDIIKYESAVDHKAAPLTLYTALYLSLPS